MAYTILDEFGYNTAIRLVSYPATGNAPILLDWLPVQTEWIRDDCSHVSRRYRITYPSGCVVELPWWQVVHHDDTPAEVAGKLDHASKLRKARLAADLAMKEFERLNGGRS